MKKRAVLLVSHGSRSPEARRDVDELVRKIGDLMTDREVSAAFLEIESPSIPDAIHSLVKSGAAEITVALHFLTLGRHAAEDIPRVIRESAQKFRGVRFCLADTLSGHPDFPVIIKDLALRAKAVEA